MCKSAPTPPVVLFKSVPVVLWRFRSCRGSADGFALSVVERRGTATVPQQLKSLSSSLLGATVGGVVASPCLVAVWPDERNSG